jgi:hypothetical protein
MSEIAVSRIAITTTGSAGTASGSGATIPINGFLLDVYIDYHASCPATADVSIADAVFGNVLVVSNNNSDGWYAPRKATCDPAAAATGLYDLIPLNGSLSITVAQADALSDCVVVHVRWMTP